MKCILSIISILHKRKHVFFFSFSKNLLKHLLKRLDSEFDISAKNKHLATKIKIYFIYLQLLQTCTNPMN